MKTHTKRKTSARLISVLLAIVLVATMVPALAFATSSEEPVNVEGPQGAEEQLNTLAADRLADKVILDLAAEPYKVAVDDAESIVSVQLGNTALDASLGDYQAVAGELTLASAVLSAFAVGAYELKVGFADGEETAILEVIDSTPIDMPEVVETNDTIIVPMGGDISPQAVGDARITKLELREGSTTGTLVADLLANPKPTMTVDTEYYLVAKVSKTSPSDDCWVSVSLPYWMVGMNLVGSAVAGGVPIVGSVDHTSIDSVVSWTPGSFTGSGEAGDGSPASQPASSGTVIYRLKDTVVDAEFSISFRASSAYFNGNTVTGEIVANPVNQLKIACGDMEGAAVGAGSDSFSTQTITKASTSYGAITTANYGWPTIATGESTTANRSFFVGGSLNGYRVRTTFELDLTSPSEASDVTVTYGGEAPTSFSTNDDGSTHYVFSVPAGTTNSKNFYMTATINGPDGTYDFPVTNIKADTYGDENDFWRACPDTFMRVYVNNDLAVSIKGENLSSCDWYDEQGVWQNALLASADLSAAGAASASTASQTIHATFDTTNSIIRTITVPKFVNAGDTIIIKAGGESKTYTLTNVAKLANTGTYAVIRNIDLDLPVNTSIEAITYEVGSLSGGDTTVKSSLRTYQYKGLAAYGSFTKGLPVTSTYTVYKTGTSSSDSSAKTTTSTTTTRELSIYSGVNAKLSDSALTAGGSTHVTTKYTSYGGGENWFDPNPTFYLILPEGFSYASFEVAGTQVSGVEITTKESTAAGVTIYQFASPFGTQAGGYLSDGTSADVEVTFDLLTSKSLSAATYNLKDIFQVGNKDFSAKSVKSNYTYIESDIYNVNQGNALRVGSSTFTVQELKEVAIDNSMRVTADSGSSWTDWMVYNEGDPNNTRAFMNTGMSAEYKVSITNQTGGDVEDCEIFVPIPKKDRNFGANFQSSKFEFDLSFVAQTPPAGFKVEYLQMNSGVSYDTKGAVPEAGDYTVLSGPAGADMVRIYATGSGFADGTSAEVVFDVTLPSSLEGSYGKMNIWNAVPRYGAGGSSFVPTGSPEAIEIAGGIITGTVYEDTNANGVMDGSEEGIAGIEVTAVDTFNPARVLTAITKSDGSYQFTLVRNTTTGGYTNDDIKLTVTVTNPDNSLYGFSPTTTTGNKPSVVSAAANHSTAAKGELSCEATTPIEVNAGLVPTKIVSYSASTGGTIGSPDKETVFHGESPVTIPTASASAGYEYKGWSINKAVVASDAITVGSTTYPAGTSIPAGTLLGTADIAKILVTEDITVTASFSPLSYQIAYLKNAPAGATVTGTMTDDTVVFNTNVTLKTNAYAATGYTFSGWNTDALGGGDAYTNAQNLGTWTSTENLTLYAQWTLNTHDITYGYVNNPSTGFAPPADALALIAGFGASDVNYGTKNIGVEAKPELAGYTFTGWSTSDVSVNTGTNTFTMPDNDVAFSGYWALNTYNITYKEVPASATNSNPATYTTESNNITFSDLAQNARPGYTFIGWNIAKDDDANGTNPVDIKIAATPGNDTKGVVLETGSYGHITATALWSINDYTVSFDLNGGANSAADYSDLTVTYNSVIRSTAGFPANPAKTGYTFAGWKMSTAGAPLLASTTPMPAENITLTAQWDPAGVSYTVYHHRIDTSGNVTATEKETRTGITGTTVNAQAKNYAPSHTYNATYQGTVATGTVQADGTLVLRLYYPINRYTVNFVDWNGSVLASRTNIPYGGSALAPANPYRAGYTFQGWDKTFTNVTSNLTVNARYTIIPIATYTVTFVDWDGSILSSQTVTRGGSATAPANPTRAGYTFTGWDRGYSNVTSNITVTALYTPLPAEVETFTITFISYGSNVLQSTTVERGGSVTPPANPTRNNYRFTGWDQPSSAWTNVTTDATIRALWSDEVGVTPPTTTQRETPTPGGGGSSAEALAAAAEAQGIPNIGVPLAAPTGFEAWALANLILMILGLMMALVFSVLRRFRRNEELDEDEREERRRQRAAQYAQTGVYVEPEEEEPVRRRRSLVWLIATIVLALVGLVLFVLTQDITLPMVWFDMWTIVQAIVLIAALVFGNIAISRKKQKQDEEDNIAPEAV